MSELIDSELADEILREVKAWYPNAFNNPKNYPEDMNNLKAEIRKLLQSRQPEKPRIMREKTTDFESKRGYEAGYRQGRIDKEFEITHNVSKEEKK